MWRTSAVMLVTLLLACGRHRAGPTVPDDRPSHMRRIRVGDVSIATTTVGSPTAPPLWIIHDGPGLDHTYLRPWLDALADHSRVVYVDLRGHGASSAPADASGFTLVAAAADLARAIEIVEPRDLAVDVLGHGFGAAVAMELASRHPERIRRVVLVDPMRSGAQLEHLDVRARVVLGEAGARSLAALLASDGTLRDPLRVSEYFKRLGTLWWHRVPSDGVIERMGRDVRYRAETAEGFTVDALGWDGRSRALELRAPTMVLAGADDRLFPPETARALADALPHGAFVTVADAGHCPFVEQNQRFVSLVDRFVRGDGRAE